MKKFILKTLLFTLPFFVLYIVTFSFYSDTETPDLLRLGCIPNIDKEYMKTFDSNEKIKFEFLSKTRKREFKILTIGDSFSDRGAIGYNNILASNFSVLNVDKIIRENQIQTLIEMVNGDFFSNYKIDYVILENIERKIVSNAKNAHLSQKICIGEINSLIENNHKKNEKHNYELFSKTTLKFPFLFLNFFLNKNYLSNNLVYNIDLNTRDSFSNNSNKLLFYREDLTMIKTNNLVSNIENLNDKLNYIAKKLEQKGIRLIVLPAPDKYDMYYSYIENNNKFEKPLFFENLKKFNKNYIYIDSKELLSKNMRNKKDIYYFGDTHWSPVAAKLIAEEIKKRINM
ncbi:alginate O-acetyltransferase AlgX-related protein [Flavobacterium sp. UBA4854]|uniref:alginate O-acetyltransferase AlgX-related protein n=1 Tax=Flavobacterium sp. UBA4854 TaxID=1946548 RepID=UPI0025802907|nr:hypothetical protein [Flavobacterium sp. UBA4854]